MVPGPQIQQDLSLEILVIGNAVVYNVKTKGAFVFDDWLKLGERR